MIKKSVYKIPEGKLVKIELEVKKGIIKKIKITGDFFMHPEEAIDGLEKSLIDSKLIKEVLVRQIDNYWESHQVDCFGITSMGLTDAILLAS